MELVIFKKKCSPCATYMAKTRKIVPFRLIFQRLSTQQPVKHKPYVKISISLQRSWFQLSLFTNSMSLAGLYFSVYCREIRKFLNDLIFQNSRLLCKSDTRFGLNAPKYFRIGFQSYFRLWNSMVFRNISSNRIDIRPKSVYFEDLLKYCTLCQTWKEKNEFRSVFFWFWTRFL